MVEISFLIPLRGRHDQVDSCLNNIANVYGDYDYEVILAYQSDNLLLKRGQLRNLAAKKAKGNVLVIQDVDTRHLIKINLEKLKDGYLGFNRREIVIDVNENSIKRTGKRVGCGSSAMIVISKQKFFEVNGFSNVYFGWGCEDHSFAWLRAKLKVLNTVLGHADHPPSTAAKILPDWYKFNRKYYKFEKILRDFSCDSVLHTIADELTSKGKVDEKTSIYYFSNIRVTKDFGQMDWYLKQIEIEKKYCHRG